MLKNIAFALCALAFAGFATPAAAGIAVGEKAPDFSLPSADGETVKLSSYAGKVVVLEWHNKGCPFVKKHYKSGNMQSLQKKYTGKDVVWLTINSSAEGKQGYETAEEAVATVKDSGAAPTHVLLDPAGAVGKLYDSRTTPNMIVINQDGSIAYAGAIDDTPTADEDDVKTAKNYVTAALDAVLEGKPVEVSSTKSYGCSVKYAD